MISIWWSLIQRRSRIIRLLKVYSEKWWVTTKSSPRNKKKNFITSGSRWYSPFHPYKLSRWHNCRMRPWWFSSRKRQKTAKMECTWPTGSGMIYWILCWMLLKRETIGITFWRSCTILIGILWSWTIAISLKFSMGITNQGN